MSKHDSGPWRPVNNRHEHFRSFDGKPKTDYGDERTAWSAADALTAEYGERTGHRWVPYPCHGCKGWHVGRPGRFSRREGLRHREAWEPELTERGQAWLRAENIGNEERRYWTVVSLFDAAARRQRAAA